MNIVIEYERKRGESMGDAADAVRALIEIEKEKLQAAESRPLSFARSPQWTENGQKVTARLPYKFA